MREFWKTVSKTMERKIIPTSRRSSPPTAIRKTTTTLTGCVIDGSVDRLVVADGEPLRHRPVDGQRRHARVLALALHIFAVHLPGPQRVTVAV